MGGIGCPGGGILEHPQSTFVVQVERSYDGSVGADDAQVDFCGAPGGGGKIGPGYIGVFDAGREDGANERAAGGAEGRSVNLDCEGDGSTAYMYPAPIRAHRRSFVRRET